MEKICYGCFSDSLNEAGICEQCGFDGAKNREKYPLALPLGSILYGRYIVGRVLGQGGFGITYLAQDCQLKGLVAIKEYFPDSMATRTDKSTVCPLSGERGENFTFGLNSFLEEARTMAQFTGNPNITRVYNYFEENGTGYFVMEYLDGESFLDAIRAQGGRICWDDAMGVVLPVTDALSAMHEKGIIHRDVTPDNIYITKDGTVKLLDFGAARHSLGNVSRSLDVILKHGFAPKEQYSRRGRQGPYTDVYSLCATIYYAITGVKPDDAIERSDKDDMPLPSNLNVKITPQQEEVLVKGLAVNAEDRYQSAPELRRALTAVTGPGCPAVAAAAGNTVPRSKKTVPATPAVNPEPPSAPESTEQAPDDTAAEKKKPLILFPWKKKAITAAACAVLLLTAFLLFWFLHPHAYREWVVTLEPSCTETGSRERKCFCGNTQTEVLESLGHTAVTDAAVPATCTEEGLTEGSHCQVCGITLLEQRSVAPLGHNIVTLEAVDPTCTEVGWTEGVGCSNCDFATTPQQEIPALGHTPVTDEAVEVTCTTDGKTEGSHCEVCGAVLTEQEIIPKTGHTPVTDPATSATCTSDGKSEGSHCETCGEILKEQTVTATKLGHSYSNYVCTRCGHVSRVTCSRCSGSGKCQSCLSNPGWCSACNGMGAWYEVDVETGETVVKICGTCKDTWYCTSCHGSANCSKCGGSGYTTP